MRGAIVIAAESAENRGLQRNTSPSQRHLITFLPEKSIGMACADKPLNSGAEGPMQS